MCLQMQSSKKITVVKKKKVKKLLFTFYTLKEMVP